MNFIAHVDHFYKVEAKAEGKTPYYRFNVYVHSEDDTVQLLSLNWRFQNDKLHPPYEIYKGKFYTPTRVSAPMADAIYRATIAKVGEMEGRTIPYNEKNRKLGQFYPRDLEKTLPEYAAHIEAEASAMESARLESLGVKVLKIPKKASPAVETTDLAFMNDLERRPSYIPARVKFLKDDTRLKWSQEKWEEWEADYQRNFTKEEIA